MRHSHEQCSSCLQLYAYETEVRCAHCDAAGCEFCAVRVEQVWYCVDCKEEIAHVGTRDVES
jgi:hypothetical protein